MTLDNLQQSLQGTIILPTDAAYDQSRSTFIRKGSPALIVKAETTHDIQLTLQYATTENLIISARSGGHSGFSTNDGGVVIDLERMKDVTLVDAHTHRVRIGGGAHWGDVAKKLFDYGLAISSGDTASVGVGGLTLGGGVGWMVRKYGLAIDSLVSADIITADGELRIASATENPDLFWAIRGGGGNFGIVTAFEFIAHPVTDVFFGSITYAAENIAELIKGWRDVMRAAPEELTTMAILFPANTFGENPAMFTVNACWANDDKTAADAALAALRKMGTVLEDTIEKKHYYEVLEDAHPSGEMRVETNNICFKDMNDTIVEKIARSFSDHGMIFQLRSLGGAMNRVPMGSTAFAHRDSEVMAIAARFFPADTTDDQIAESLKPWNEIATLGKGSYSNFFSNAADDKTKMAYPEQTYQKLATIKTTFDPKNIFHQNHNIAPQTQSIRQ